MKKVLGCGLFVLMAAVAISGCSKKNLRIDVGETPPTVVKSIDDLPKPATTSAEIIKSGYIRVIGESARGQEQYDALTAARGIAQRNALSVVQGTRIDSDMLIKKGELTEDEVRLLVNGHIRTYDCGAYYDKALRVGYHCVEIPVR